jgi:hypothetical protein
MPWRTFSRELERKRRAPPRSKDADEPTRAGWGRRVPDFESRNSRQLEIILTARLAEVGSAESTGPARFSTTSS